MSTIFVVPKENVTVKDDIGRVIPVGGKEVNKSIRIKRIINEGDLTVRKVHKEESGA